MREEQQHGSREAAPKSKRWGAWAGFKVVVIAAVLWSVLWLVIGPVSGKIIGQWVFWVIAAFGFFLMGRALLVGLLGLFGPVFGVIAIPIANVFKRAFSGPGGSGGVPLAKWLVAVAISLCLLIPVVLGLIKLGLIDWGMRMIGEGVSWITGIEMNPYTPWWVLLLVLSSLALLLFGLGLLRVLFRGRGIVNRLVALAAIGALLWLAYIAADRLKIGPMIAGYYETVMGRPILSWFTAFIVGAFCVLLMIIGWIVWLVRSRVGQPAVSPQRVVIARPAMLAPMPATSGSSATRPPVSP